MKTAVALGTFDGVHKGHLSVINAAASSGFKPVAVAFPEPPKGIISGDKNLLTNPIKKREILIKSGINEVFYLDFKKIRDYSPEQFLKLLKNEFNPAVICCGFNYRFGKNGEGDTGLLKDFCKKNEIKFIEAQPVTAQGRVISSTYIRELLEQGMVAEANGFLSEPFGFNAQVIHGDKRGRTIGFPTVNMVYSDSLVEVRFGVYKSEITVDDKTYSGITNVGMRPSFRTEKIMAETYICDFSGDVYGKIINVKLLNFIRPEQKFETLQELKANIMNDIQKAY